MPTARSDLILSMKAEQGNIVSMLKSLQKSVGDVQKKLDGMAVSATKAGKTAEKAVTRMTNKMVGASNRIGSAFRSTFGQISILLGTGGFVGSVVQAIRTTTDFESKLSEVSTLLGTKASQQMGVYEQAIRSMALNGSASIGELTNALYQTISAGVKGSETTAGSIELVKTASKAAVAGLSSTFAAVDVITTSLNAYQLSTENASKISDVLFTTVRLGKTRFDELASTIGNVASIAANANVSFGDVNAAIVAMTKGGLSTDIAVTSLRATISSILKPSKELEAVMKQFGFSSAAAALEQEGLVGFMRMLKDETGGNAEAMQRLIPNIRALSGVSILAGTGFDSLASASEEMVQSAGATETAYAKMADTFEFKTKRFRNLINEVFLKIGEKIIPILIEKMEQISAWVDQNGEKIAAFVKSAVEAIVSFGEWVIQNGATIAATLGTIWAVGKVVAMTKAVRELFGTVRSFGAFLGTTGGALSIFAGGLSAAVAGASALAGALKNAREEGKKMVEDLRAGFTGITLDLLGEKTRKEVEFTSNALGELIETAIKKPTEMTFDALEIYKKRASKVVESLNNDIARVQQGLLDPELKEAARAAVEARGGEFVGFVGAKEQRILIDQIKEQRREIERMIREAGEKQREIIRKLGEETVEEETKRQAKIFELTKAHREALVAFDKKGIDFLSQAERRALNELVAHETAVRGNLTKQEEKLFDRFLKARMQKIRKAVEDEMREREKAEQFLFRLRLSNMDAEQRARAQFEATLESIKQMNFAKEEQRTEAEHELRKKLERDLEKIQDAAYKKEAAALKKVADEREAAIKKWVDGIDKTINTEREWQKMFLSMRVETGTEEERRQAKIQLIRLQNEEEIAKVREQAAALGVSSAEAERMLGDRLKKQIGELTEEKGLFDGLGKKIADGFLETLGRRGAEISMQLASMIGRPLEEFGLLFVRPLDQVSQLISTAFSGEGIPRMEESLNQFLDFWNNLAQNMGPVIEWLTAVGVPTLIEAFVANMPTIIEAITSNLPGLVYALIDGALQVVNVLIAHIPQIIDAVINSIPMIITAIIKNIPLIALEIGKQVAQVIKNVITGRWGGETSWLKGEEGLLPDEIPILGKLHEGGMIKQGISDFGSSVGAFMRAVKAHDGVFVKPVLQPDEVPIIGKVGEAVMNDSWVRQVGGEQAIDRMNREALSPAGARGAAAAMASTTNVTNVFNIEHMFAQKAREVIDNMVGENNRLGGKTAAIVGGDAVPGFASRRK